MPSNYHYAPFSTITGAYPDKKVPLLRYGEKHSTGPTLLGACYFVSRDVNIYWQQREAPVKAAKAHAEREIQLRSLTSSTDERKKST